MLYSYEKFLLELGRRLRQMRIDRGFTLRAMIVQHGFHLAQWQGFEKGRGISVPSLLRICDVFDLTLEQLIAGAGIAETRQDSSASEALAAEPACEPPRKAISKKRAAVARPAKSRPSPASPAPRSRPSKR